MSKTFIGLLVGMHFHPPAKLILPYMPGGTELILEPEPENPYDSGAIKVSVDPCKIALSEEALSSLDSEILAGGMTLEQFMSSGAFMLGHVGASGGKPLSKARQSWPELAGSLSGNAEFNEWLKDPGHRARLGFAPTGDPLVMLSIP